MNKQNLLKLEKATECNYDLEKELAEFFADRIGCDDCPFSYDCTVLHGIGCSYFLYGKLTEEEKNE